MSFRVGSRLLSRNALHNNKNCSPLSHYRNTTQHFKRRLNRRCSKTLQDYFSIGTSTKQHELQGSLRGITSTGFCAESPLIMKYNSVVLLETDDDCGFLLFFFLGGSVPPGEKCIKSLLQLKPQDLQSATMLSSYFSPHRFVRFCQVL